MTKRLSGFDKNRERKTQQKRQYVKEIKGRGS
ncbi:hypothetical protein BSNT_08535 [Bacillus subtilis subsp. natto BEST195]|nr:hypothetical protein BSNT_08535 [Bacillus subtilis subsp. natto BEST195]